MDYTYRAHLGRRWALAYSVGPGGYYFDLSGTNYDPVQCEYYGNCASSSQDFGSAFRLMLSQQLALDYRFNAPTATHESETGVGLALYDFWIPSGSWGPVPVSGNSFGAVVFFLTGW